MEAPQPVIVLVHTQMGENIGMCARAMLNCGLNQLRLVAPRDGWPNQRAVATAADADEVIENVQCYETVREAVADCVRVFATTARSRARQIPAADVETAVGEIKSSEGKSAILFGPEASGLDNDSLACADSLLDFPINPDFNSLNLAQAVLLFGWEWWKGETEVQRNPELPAEKQDFARFMDRLETRLDRGGFFPSDDLRPETVRNLQVLFGRIAPSDRELRMLHGVISALGGTDKNPL